LGSENNITQNNAIFILLPFSCYYVVDLYSIQDSQETALMVAAREGNVESVKKLIQEGANVNLTNKVTELVW